MTTRKNSVFEHFSRSDKSVDQKNLSQKAKKYITYFKQKCPLKMKHKLKTQLALYYILYHKT